MMEVCTAKGLMPQSEWMPKRLALFRWCGLLALIHVICQFKDMNRVFNLHHSNEDQMSRKLSLPQMVERSELNSSNSLKRKVTTVPKNSRRTGLDVETERNGVVGTRLRGAVANPISGVQDLSPNDITSSLAKRHAYVFLVAACDPDKKSYQGFLYNVLVASYVLRTSGTKSDIVVLVQMAADTQSESLPESDVLPLRKLNVIIKYLEKPTAEDNFYNAMLAKFRVLEMVEYSRILFMDADVLPHGNLDYIFTLSEGENAILKENMVIATSSEPSNGGFFMLAPKPNDSEELQAIIRRQHDQAKATGVAFNFTTAWGHQIEAPDEWRDSVGKRGRNWKFHGSFADQGLLYHWTKYVKKNVSIVVEKEIENWSSSEDGRPYLERVMLSANISGFGTGHKLRVQPSYKACPYRDFTHFSAKRKPWEAKVVPADLKDAKAASGGAELWFHLLRKINSEFNMGLDVETIPQTVGTPNLGRFPTLDHVRKAAKGITETVISNK